MPLFATLRSKSAFKNGDSFAVIEGNQQPIRVKRIIRSQETDLVVFCVLDRPGMEYTGEISIPDQSVICLDGGYCGAEEFLAAKTRVLNQLCTWGAEQLIRVTGPVADYTSRIGNRHSVGFETSIEEVVIWHVESPEKGLSKFWFTCKSGIWRAESHLGTRRGIAKLATF